MQGTLIPKITFQVPREGKYQTVYLLRRLITSFVSKWFFLCTKFCYNLDMDLLISFRMVYFSTVVYHHCQHMNQLLTGRMRGHWFLVKGWLKAFHLSITGLFISCVLCNLLIWFCYFIILKIMHFLMISNSFFFSSWFWCSELKITVKVLSLTFPAGLVGEIRCISYIYLYILLVLDLYLCATKLYDLFIILLGF